MKQPNSSLIHKKKKKKKKKRHDYDNVVVCIPKHCSALSTIFTASSSQEKNNQHLEIMSSSSCSCFLEKEKDDHNDGNKMEETIHSHTGRSGSNKRTESNNSTQPTTTSFCREEEDIIRRRSDHHSGDRLYIQCHYDRIIWNLFHPLFIIQKNTAAAMHAIEIIIHAFETFIIQQQQQQSSSSPWYGNHSVEKKETNEQSNTGNDATTTTTTTTTTMQPWNEQLWNCHNYQFTTTTTTTATATTTTKDPNSSPPTTTKILHLILLPVHYPIPSPHFHNNNHDRYHPQSHKLYTEQLFTSALVRQENLYIKLQTLNAFIATMGGGYFLCRYLNTAIKLARYQRLVALALDDVPLAMKCTINEAYNYIHAGQIDRAKRLIRQTKKQAKERACKEENGNYCNHFMTTTSTSSDSMNVILGMCRSALWFAKGVERAGLKEDTMEEVTTATTTPKRTQEQQQQQQQQQVQRQATRDDFLRIRIVTSK